MVSFQDTSDHTHTHARTHTHAHARTHAHTCTRMHARTHTHAHTRTRTTAAGELRAQVSTRGLHAPLCTCFALPCTHAVTLPPPGVPSLLPPPSLSFLQSAPRSSRILLHFPPSLGSPHSALWTDSRSHHPVGCGGNAGALDRCGPCLSLNPKLVTWGGGTY